MLVLLKTYLDIIALRKGPDAVPASWLVLNLSLAILAFAWLFQVSLADDPDRLQLLEAVEQAEVPEEFAWLDTPGGSGG